MESEDLLKKLRSSLSMRKNVPLSQLIRECNSDWNINVYKIYSEISGIYKLDLKDIATWLGTNESFGDEHADLRRYINVSKPKKKRTNQKTSYLVKGFRGWKDSSLSNRRSRTRQSSFTSLNNSWRQKISIKQNEKSNCISTKTKNFANMVSNAGKSHLGHAIFSATCLNKRLENQKRVESLENEVIRSFNKVNLDGTTGKRYNFIEEDKVCYKNNSCENENFALEKDLKYGSEKSFGEKAGKNCKKDIPTYICGRDAIEALLKERKRIVTSDGKELLNNHEYKEIKDNFTKNEESQKSSTIEFRKPLAVLQSSNQEFTNVGGSSISNEIKVKNFSFKKFENDEQKKEKFILEKKVEKKTKFSYSFPKPSFV